MNNYIDDYIETYITETHKVADLISKDAIKEGIELLEEVRENGGRLFILGVGGSAGNASHAVNDFRKIGHIETYAPTDNVSELTARTNDEGWNTTFSEWLKISRISFKDALLILSVGGGSANTSGNIVEAIDLAKSVDAKILSIVSRDGGYAKEKSDVCILIPVVSDKRITPHAEGWQGVIWHLMVNKLAEMEGKK